MKASIVIVLLALCVFSGIVFAANEADNNPVTGFTEETISTVADTTKTAVGGTVGVAEKSVKNTMAVPMTAIQATKDTANTAFDGADKAMKAVTGEKE